MISWLSRLRRAVTASLTEPVARDHAQSDRDFLRRRLVVGVTLVIGAVLLGLSLSVRPGDATFYILTASVALTWAIGGFASGPLHRGHLPSAGGLRRPWLVPVVIGLLAGAVFLAGALIVREIPPLDHHVDSVLAHARHGAIVPIVAVTVINGIAEEIFFRGALYAAIGSRYAVAGTTVVYALATAATGNPMLVFAAVTLGIVLALQRRASGGILAPILTHVTWSVLLLFALPPIVGR